MPRRAEQKLHKRGLTANYYTISRYNVHSVAKKSVNSKDKFGDIFKEKSQLLARTNKSFPDLPFTVVVLLAVTMMRIQKKIH